MILKKVVNWENRCIETYYRGARTVTVYVAGEKSHVISFSEAMAYQRNIVAHLLRSLDRNGFQMVDPTSDGAWVYEGWAI